MARRSFGDTTLWRMPMARAAGSRGLPEPLRCQPRCMRGCRSLGQRHPPSEMIKVLAAGMLLRPALNSRHYPTLFEVDRRVMSHRIFDGAGP